MEQLEIILVTAGVSVSMLLAIIAYIVFTLTGDISRKFLSFFLGVTALFIFSLGYESLRFNALFIYVRAVLLLLFLPTFYLYIKTVFTLGHPVFPASFKHFLPAVVMGVLIFSMLIITRLSGQQISVDSDIRNNSLWFFIGHYLVMAFIFIQLFIYTFTVSNNFPSYISTLREYYSNIAPFKPRWLFWLMGVFVAFYVLADIAMMLSVIGYDFYQSVFSLFMTALVLSTAYYGISLAPLVSRNKEGDLVFTTLSHRVIARQQPITPCPLEVCECEVKKKDFNHLIEALEKLMAKEALYLDNELTLYDLAATLSTNTNYLSRAINETYGINFNSYINRLRIDKVIALMKEEKKENYSLWGLGQHVGFYSKSAFINAFKRETGFTPNEYLKTVRIGEFENVRM
jgi:AraC-like DNA-binding protein